MRKIEQQMNSAIANGINWASGNTQVTHVDGIAKVYLHGHNIANIDLSIPAQVDGAIEMFSCGWRTVTTKSRLNAILQGFTFSGKAQIFQKDFTWYVGTLNQPFYEGCVI